MIPANNYSAFTIISLTNTSNVNWNVGNYYAITIDSGGGGFVRQYASGSPTTLGSFSVSTSSDNTFFISYVSGILTARVNGINITLSGYTAITGPLYGQFQVFNGLNNSITNIVFGPLQAGPTGQIGPSGPTGPIGITGPTGPLSSDANAWTSYTPVWTTDSSPQPAIGSGTLTGKYKAIGKSVFFTIKLNYAADTSGGNGAWHFSLPINAVDSAAVVAPSTYLYNGHNWNFGVANTEYKGDVGTVTPLCLSPTGNTAGAVDATHPFTWVNTDTMVINGTYQSV